jgi:REP element-mobilizing transposase RayT
VSVNDKTLSQRFYCTTIRWIALFGSQPIVRIILDSLKYLQDNQRMRVYAYVIMENHIHLILSSRELSKELGDFKSFTARKIIDFLEERNAKHILQLLKTCKSRFKKDRMYQLWQEGSHPQAILSEKMMIQKIEYIHYNPVKRGYVDKPEHWRYSSARDYAGMEGSLMIRRFSLVPTLRVGTLTGRSASLTGAMTNYPISFPYEEMDR